MDQLDSLRDWLASNYGLEINQLTDQTSLFSSGLLDSINFIEVISQFEKVTNGKVNPIDFSIENFDTIEQMRTFANKNAG